MHRATILAAMALAACNTTTEPGIGSAAVAPTAIDSSITADLTCPELAERRLWAASILYPEETRRTVTAEQAAVLDFDRSNVEMTDQDVANVKGYLLSVDTAMLQKDCSAS